MDVLLFAHFFPVCAIVWQTSVDSAAATVQTPTLRLSAAACCYGEVNGVPKVTSSKIETRIYVSSDRQCFHIYDYAAFAEIKPDLHHELLLHPQFYESLETSVVPGSANSCL